MVDILSSFFRVRVRGAHTLDDDPEEVEPERDGDGVGGVDVMFVWM